MINRVCCITESKISLVYVVVTVARHERKMEDLSGRFWESGHYVGDVEFRWSGGVLPIRYGGHDCNVSLFARRGRAGSTNLLSLKSRPDCQVDPN